MSDSGMTKLFQALNDEDMDEARRICEGMSRGARARLSVKAGILREMLDDLNVEHCLHCGKRIGKVHPDQIRGGSRNQTIWFHFGTHGVACAKGSTSAEPAPHND